MILYIVAISAMIALSALHLTVTHMQKRQWIAYTERKEAEWNAERRDLLDRIQAPTFAEYTNKVIKEKRLEQPQEQEEEESPYIA